MSHSINVESREVKRGQERERERESVCVCVCKHGLGPVHNVIVARTVEEVHNRFAAIRNDMLGDIFSGRLLNQRGGKKSHAFRFVSAFSCALCANCMPRVCERVPIYVLVCMCVCWGGGRKRWLSWRRKHTRHTDTDTQTHKTLLLENG